MRWLSKLVIVLALTVFMIPTMANAKDLTMRNTTRCLVVKVSMAGELPDGSTYSGKFTLKPGQTIVADIPAGKYCAKYEATHEGVPMASQIRCGHWPDPNHPNIAGAEFNCENHSGRDT